MPISPVGKGSERGFTLIELLVVVSIVAMLALGLGLRAGGGLGTARTPPQRLAEAVGAWQERAVLGRQVLGVMPLSDGWQAMIRQGEDWVAEGTPVRLGAAVSWRVDGMAWVPGGIVAAPPILFLPQGQHIPFRADFGAGRVCVSTGWGAPSCG